ncbi:hypothetical protein J1605_015650 [Eschrichtius robustus]|uniref:CATSPERD/E C-terminal domain-containing protein n=1 Tax=Eschrichtius robustus TaxID=9764 RepID=A0AB34GAG2_ESCRO|nr:hypothetical protein J1605_015650 [Eschrichtius robustus]
MQWLRPCNTVRKQGKMSAAKPHPQETEDTRTQVFCLFTLDLVNMQKRVQSPKRCSKYLLAVMLINSLLLKGKFDKKECLQHDFFYIIEKSYLRDRPSKHLRVKYNWEKYGCPLRVDFREKFHPVVQLYNDSGYVEDVEVNFIVWEIHGRDDYSFNNTMKKSGCLHEAQTWKSMTELNKRLPLEEAWGPENYKHCFSYAIGKPGDLNQPYEIINKSNHNHLVWPLDHSGIFCNLTTIFAIETFGVIPSPSAYMVAAFLFLLMLLFFSILVLSYFHYLRIYREYIYEPLHKSERKQKNN